MPVQQHTTAWSDSSGGDLARRRLRADGPLGVVPGAQRAMGQYLVAAAAQLREEEAGDGFVHVRGDGDPHAPEATRQGATGYGRGHVLPCSRSMLVLKRSR